MVVKIWTNWNSQTDCWGKWEKFLQLLIKLNMYLPPTSNSTPEYLLKRNESIFPQREVQKCSQPPLLTKTKNWKLPQCPKKSG